MKSLEERAKFHKAGTILHGDDGSIYEVTDNGSGEYALINFRDGPWCQVRGGRTVYIQDIKEHEIRMGDIAHALGMQVRWNGWVSHFYSVAQHSVYVSIRAVQIAKELGCEDDVVLLCSLLGLLHDASESYLGDLITPVKSLMPLYYEIEEKNQGAIVLKYTPKWATEDMIKFALDVVKKADKDLLFIERDRLIWCGNECDPYPFEDENPHLTFEDIAPQFETWDPVIAKMHFMERYFDISTDITER